MSFGSLESVFGSGRYRLAFVIALAVLSPLLAVSSNIVVPSTLDINPGAEAPDILLVGAISVLIALNLSVLLHNLELSAPVNGGGALGAFAALFTSACPVCQPIWLVWLGFGSATAFLAEFGRYISVLSIAMLAVSLHHSLKAASGTCEVKIDGKNA